MPVARAELAQAKYIHFQWLAEGYVGDRTSWRISGKAKPTWIMEILYGWTQGAGMGRSPNWSGNAPGRTSIRLPSSCWSANHGSFNHGSSN